MPDYNESTVSGKSWQRCPQVLISNPHEGKPVVRLSEETVVTVGDKKFTESLPGIQFEFDPNIVIQLRNPETGAPIGATMTGIQVYVALYSLYIQKAMERDAAQA